MRLSDLVGRRVASVEAHAGMYDEAAHGFKLVFDDGTTLEVDASTFYDQALIEVKVTRCEPGAGAESASSQVPAANEAPE